METSWLSLTDANTRWVMTGALFLGLSSGVLGSFALLKRQSLMGDTLAHAALPGIAIAFLITGTKSVGPLLVGAAAAGLLGNLLVSLITRQSKIKEDTAMATVLTFSFGAGIMLVNLIQRMPGGNQSGLDRFLFGQAASLVGRDVQVMMAVAGLLCLTTLFLFKELKLLAFDPGFGAQLGLPVLLLDHLLSLMIVLAVMIGLESVGVALTAALLITPATAARYWTDRLHVMVLLAGLFGATAGVVGTLLSQIGPRMPTGPLIVLTAAGLFVLSLLLAPRRGILARAIRLMRTRRRMMREKVLQALYDLAEASADPEEAFAPADLQRRCGLGGSLPTILRRLEQDGLVRGDGHRWSLSPAGLQLAYRLVRQQRLLSVYLMHQAELGRYHLDPEAEGPLFPTDLAQELEGLLRLHALEPRLRPEPVLQGVM